MKEIILKNHMFTHLWYGRINKKLWLNLSKNEIEKFIYKIIKNTSENFIIKKWKNFYIKDIYYNTIITINSYTFTIITVNKIC